MGLYMPIEADEYDSKICSQADSHPIWHNYQTVVDVCSTPELSLTSFSPSWWVTCQCSYFMCVHRRVYFPRLRYLASGKCIGNTFSLRGSKVLVSAVSMVGGTEQSFSTGFAGGGWNQPEPNNQTTKHGCSSTQRSELGWQGLLNFLPWAKPGFGGCKPPRDERGRCRRWRSAPLHVLKW